MGVSLLPRTLLIDVGGEGAPTWLCTVCSRVNSSSATCTNHDCRLSFKVAGVPHGACGYLAPQQAVTVQYGRRSSLRLSVVDKRQQRADRAAARSSPRELRDLQPTDPEPLLLGEELRRCTYRAYVDLCPCEVPVAPEIKLHLVHAGSSTDALSDYQRICKLLLPNLPHADVLEPSAGCFHALLRSVKGEVLGGATFRLVQLSQSEEGWKPELLLLHVARAVIAPSAQRRGLGACLVRYLRAVLLTHAAVRTQRALIVTQADNSAIDFWRKCGLEPRSGARTLSEALFRWAAHDFPLCEGARPMLQFLSRTPVPPAEFHTPKKEAKGRATRFGARAGVRGRNVG